MSYDGWRTNSEPVQPENEHSHRLGWWTQFLFAQKNGYGKEFLDSARRFRTAPVETLRKAERHLEEELRVLVTLDVLAGEDA